MGRIGDGDVHAAYVEFRAKESDKVIISLPDITKTSLPPIPIPDYHTYQYSSAYQHNVSIVNPSGPKTPLDSANTSLSVPTTYRR